MATMRLVPSTYTLSSTTYLQISDADNLYTNTDSTTYAQVTHNRANTTAYYLYLHGFDFSSIPSDAENISFTVKIKGLESGLSTSSTYRVSLYNNNTSISNTTASTSFGTTAQTITIPIGSLTWSTLKGYGNNFRIRVPLRRSNQSTSGYVRIYGAEIEVTYTIPVYHDITIQNSTSATVTASDTHPLEETDVEIIANTLSGLTVKDNGVDVTSQFVNGLSGSVSAVPGSYDTGGSINGTNYQSTIGKGSDTANRTGNDYFSTSQGASGSTWIDYFFDFSDIPTGATILSVSLTVKGHCESTSQSREISRVQAYAGSTAKGSATNMTDSTTDKVYTVSVGTWTAAELHQAKLRHEIGVYGGLVSGATWTVSYEVDGYVYTISNVAEDHVIVVSPSGGGDPPVITVGTPSRSVIGVASGYDQCVCTFVSDLALIQWEARATKAGVTPARGVGLLVESGGTLAANTPATIYVENEELTNGDGVYTITVYGQSTGGIWSE